MYYCLTGFLSNSCTHPLLFDKNKKGTNLLIIGQPYTMQVKAAFVMDKGVLNFWEFLFPSCKILRIIFRFNAETGLNQMKLKRQF